MRSRDGKTHHRRDEAHAFRVTLMNLRTELGWNQETLAAKLRVTARTVSSWENGYWLPPLKQRLHILLALRDVPPEYVLRIADDLHLSADPAHDSFLEPFRRAVYGEEAERAPRPETPRLPADSVQIRAVVDAVVGEVAGALGVAPADVRAGVARVLAACLQVGGSIEEAHRALAATAEEGSRR